MALEDDLSGAADAAAGFAGSDERVAAVLAAEPSGGARVYVCAFDGSGARAWLALDAQGEPVTSRALVREAVSLVALCEVAGEAAGDPPPRLATPSYLDEFGAPDVIGGASASVDALLEEVESAYKRDLG